MFGHAATDELERLRAELDSIDQVLLDAVRDRICCCVRIADVKRHHGIPMMQLNRIDHVHRRAGAYAAEHGLDTAFMRRLYDLIIDEACRIEELVIAEAAN
jgi:4-amino-4-deoxychorismate mutase